MSEIEQLRDEISTLAAGVPTELRREARVAVGRLLRALERGQVRAAERTEAGTWKVNAWVKEGILLGFRLGRLASLGDYGPFSFMDKDTLPVRHFRVEDGVRIVPGGTSVRGGSFVGDGVICMPPSFINVGAYVGEGTLIDSHALVGSCAQVGRRVHLACGAQLGGVLEPAGALPVIVEDNVLVGGNCGIFEGTIVREGAVLAPGVTLSAGTVVHDVVNDTEIRSSPDFPLEIPPNAVVVPGTRPVNRKQGAGRGLAVYAPIIVKYRDERTNRAVKLEDKLRGGR